MHFVMHIDLHFYSINVYILQGNIKIRDNPTEELDHLKMRAKTHRGTQLPEGTTVHEQSQLAKCTSSFGIKVKFAYLHINMLKIICPYELSPQK